MAAHYSALPRDYLVAPANNALYGPLQMAERRAERELFPGIVLVLLAVAGLWPPLSPTRIACFCGLILAFDGSMGTNGFIYPRLYEWLLPFRGLRVPARFSILVVLSLCILAGYGLARLRSRARSRWGRAALAAGLVLAALFECRSHLDLQSVKGEPPAVYRWFQGRPTSVIADLPLPLDESASWLDARFMYYSTFHWQRLVNGNSGIIPQSYRELIGATRYFPNARSLAALRRHQVDYVVVHEERFGRSVYRMVVTEIATLPDLEEVNRATTDGWESRIYRLSRAGTNLRPTLHNRDTSAAMVE